MTFLFHNARLVIYLLSVVFGHFSLLVNGLYHSTRNLIISIGVFSAGLGVLTMAVQAVSRMAGANGIPSNHQFYLIDKDVRFFCLHWPDSG